MYFYFISHFLYFTFFQNLKRKSILINSHSNHLLQSIWVRFQLKSDCSRQITQRYFVFPYFISVAMKKHFLKHTLLLLRASAKTITCISSSKQANTNSTRWLVTPSESSTSTLSETRCVSLWRKTLCWCPFQLTCPALSTSLASAIWTGWCPFPSSEGSNVANRAMWKKTEKRWFFSSFHPSNSGIRLRAH